MCITCAQYASYSSYLSFTLLLTSFVSILHSRQQIGLVSVKAASISSGGDSSRIDRSN